jgi:hypothetical protein
MTRCLSLAFLVLVVLVPAARADLPSLELRWHLDEFDAQALTTLDSSGRDRAGTLSTRVPTVAGRFASGFGFGTSGAAVTTPSASALQPAGLSLAAWVRAPSNPNAGGSGPQRIAGLGGTADCGQTAYALQVAPDGTVTFNVADASDTDVASFGAGPLQVWDGAWHALVGVYSNGSLYLYLDGNYVGGLGAHKDVTGPLSYGANPGPFAAGGCPLGAQQYMGELDEVRLYSSALADTDIAWLSRPPAGAAPPVLPAPPSALENVSARLPMDQIDPGTTTPDISGHNNTGKSVAATTTLGKYANALDFASSGTSSGLLIDDNADLHPQQFTVSTWVKYTRTINDQSRTIVGKSAGDVPPRYCSAHSWALRLGVNDTSVMTSGLDFYVSVFTHDGGQTFLEPPIVPYGQVFDGTWHAIAASYANGTAKVYVDGALSTSAALPASAIGPGGFPEEVDYSWRFSNNQIGVGRYPDPTCALQGFRFPGAIDDLRIYDRELTPAEIAAIQTASSPAPDPIATAAPTPTPPPTPTPTVTVTSTSVPTPTVTSTPVPTKPKTTVGAIKAASTTSVDLSATINPQGLPTTMHFEYGTDVGGTRAVTFVSTPEQNVGSDFTDHTVTSTGKGLLPNSSYTVRAVATNPSGATASAEQTVATPADPPPPPPVIGETFNLAPVSGLVLVKRSDGTFVPLTEPSQIIPGAVIDARRGVLQLTTATGKKQTVQKGRFRKGVFSVTQSKKRKPRGLVELRLARNIDGKVLTKGCKSSRSGDLTGVAAKKPSKKVLNLLKSDAKGKFRTTGKYSAATVRGTKWDMADRCDGTLTKVHRGLVDVEDFAKRKTIAVSAGHSYLAKR